MQFEQNMTRHANIGKNVILYDMLQNEIISQSDYELYLHQKAVIAVKKNMLRRMFGYFSSKSKEENDEYYHFIIIQTSDNLDFLKDNDPTEKKSEHKKEGIVVDFIKLVTEEEKKE